MTEIDQIVAILKRMDTVKREKIQDTIKGIIEEQQTEWDCIKTDYEHNQGVVNSINAQQLTSLPASFCELRLKDIKYEIAVMNDNGENDGFTNNWLSLKIDEKNFHDKLNHSNFDAHSKSHAHSSKQSALKKNCNKENSQNSVLASGVKARLNTIPKSQNSAVKFTPNKLSSFVPSIKNKPPRALKSNEKYRAIFLSQEGSPLIVNDNIRNQYKNTEKPAANKSIKQY